MTLAEKLHEFTTLAHNKYDSHAFAAGAFESLISVMENEANSAIVHATLDYLIKRVEK